MSKISENTSVRNADVVKSITSFKNPRMYESQFRDEILPVWMANKGKPVEEHDKSAYDAYLDVVKNEFTRVDIHDDETQEFLYWVPALRYHSDLTDIDVSGLHRQAMAMKSQSGEAYIRMTNQIAEAATRKTTRPPEDTEQWRAILARYGYAKGKGVANAKVGEEPSDSPAGNMEFEDEGW